MDTLSATTCYYPNAAKLIPLGYEPDGFDAFGRRIYLSAEVMIAVNCAKGASGEVTIWRTLDTGLGVGRMFTGLLWSEQFFDQLLVAVGAAHPAPTAPEVTEEAGA